MDLNCPKCGSDHTQKVSAIHSHGTSYGSASSASTTYGVVGSNAAVASTSTSTKSFSQSVLAERLAPPLKMRTNWFLPTIFGGAILSIFGALGGSLVGGVIFEELGFRFKWGMETGAWLGAILTFAYILMENYRRGARARKYNKEKYPSELEAWRKKFYCHRCDNVFAVST